MSDEETFWEPSPSSRSIPEASPDLFKGYNIEKSPDLFSDDTGFDFDSVVSPTANNTLTDTPLVNKPILGATRSLPGDVKIKQEPPPSIARTPKKKERKKILDIAITVEEKNYVRNSNIHKILKRILHLKHALGRRGTVFFNSDDILKIVENGTKQGTRKRCKSSQTDI
jgi:hypothetical protein